MLLQSHTGEVHLLPALPRAWPDGSVKGLRARGGFTVDITWKKAAGGSPHPIGPRQPLRLRYGKQTLEEKPAKGQTLVVDGELK